MHLLYYIYSFFSVFPRIVHICVQHHVARVYVNLFLLNSLSAGTTREHLGLAMALKVPIFIVVSKVDLCAKSTVEKTVRQLERVLKQPGCNKVPMVVANPDDAVTAAQQFAQSSRYTGSTTLVTACVLLVCVWRCIFVPTVLRPSLPSPVYLERIWTFWRSSSTYCLLWATARNKRNSCSSWQNSR